MHSTPSHGIFASPMSRPSGTRRALPAIFAIASAMSAHGLDPRLDEVNDWLYVLQLDQGAGPAAIAASEFDLAVIDYSTDGTRAGELAPADVALIKDSGKVVLSYLSIGEAEIQRFYWNPAWNDQGAADPDAPAWLGPFNPDFPDNFKVRYWDAAWQALMLGTASGPQKSYLDRIIDQGFDGVYLDIIDAYEFWSEDQPERTRQQARAEMIDLVVAIAVYARQTRGQSNFLVFPQNGAGIIVNNNDNLDAMGTNFLGVIDGIGAEDVFYDELTAQPPSERDYVLPLLDLFLSSAGQTRAVLSVDYTENGPNHTSAGNIARYNDYQALALARGFIPFAALRNRNLDEIFTVEAIGGFEQPQPKSNDSAARAWKRY